MTEIYKFKVQLNGLKREMWRDFEITSQSTILKLCDVVLSSYKADFDHLYSLTYRGVCYDPFPDEGMEIVETKSANKKLSSLNMYEKDKMDLWYDYGDDWHFTITFLSSREMLASEKTGMFPKFLKGKGKGIIDDVGGVYGLMEVIDEIKESGKSERLIDWGFDEDYFLDYEKFNTENPYED